jgi:hypothetical protein
MTTKTTLTYNQSMSRVLFFYPENDLALAHGGEFFTAPAAAVKLRKAGEMLPLWFADDDDRVLCEGVNAEWLRKVRESFGIKATVFDHHPTEGQTPYPWGWSAAVRRTFINSGFSLNTLPSMERIAAMRELSHRRTASAIVNDAQALLTFKIAPAAVEAKTIEEVEAMLDGGKALIMKSPWSSSGRGLLTTRNSAREEILRQAAGTIRRQGSILVEQEWGKIEDFALLYDADGEGRVSFVGFSVFMTNERGAYIGNRLASEEALHKYMQERFGEIDAVIDAIGKALAKNIAGDYCGPLGVDMMLIKSPESEADTMVAVCEVNLRMTMGRVAHEFAARHLAEGSTGTYQVLPTAITEGIDNEPIIKNGKLVEGAIDLTPKNQNFTFRVSAKRD